MDNFVALTCGKTSLDQGLMVWSWVWEEEGENDMIFT